MNRGSGLKYGSTSIFSIVMVVPHGTPLWWLINIWWYMMFYFHASISGVPYSHGGTPIAGWFIIQGQSQSRMDDEWVPHFWEPPHVSSRSQIFPPIFCVKSSVIAIEAEDHAAQLLVWLVWARGVAMPVGKTASRAAMAGTRDHSLRFWTPGVDMSIWKEHRVAMNGIPLT